MFEEENNFVIIDETNPAGRKNVDDPIFLLKGEMKTTLADSKSRDIVVLRHPLTCCRCLLSLLSLWASNVAVGCTQCSNRATHDILLRGD
jgi:hypothetical protein